MDHTGIPQFSRVVKRRHRIYTHVEIDPILDYLSLDVIPYGALTIISRDTGIPTSTLQDWRTQRRSENGSTWFPLAIGHPNRRIFTDAIEDAISDHLEKNLIDPGLGATRLDVKQLAINAYGSLPNESIRFERFSASPHYIGDFLERYDLKLRTPHEDRRPDVSEDAVARFLERYNSMQNDYPPDKVYNFDETCWRRILPRCVLAKKGTETVKLRCKQNTKESVTAFATVSLSGEKLPLWVIAKGESDRSLTKYGRHTNLLLKTSENGWSNKILMLEYLQWLHIWAGEVPIMLVMDCFSAHTCDEVRAYAEELDIELLFVPAGGTAEYQPLDRRIFGELKSRASHEFDRWNILDGSRNIPLPRMLEVLSICWGRISEQNIKKAWILA
jgi:hypothetical protein